MVKFLIIIVCIYLLLRWVAPVVLRFLAKRLFRKMAQNGGNYQYQYRSGSSKSTSGQQQRKKSGEINIDYIPNNKKQFISDDEGEYVDFEDVK